MACNLPENYLLHPDAFQFIKDVPGNWEDTRILAAEPVDFIAIARKAKDRPGWFAGIITDENSSTITIEYNFLEAGGKYDATIYQDADWELKPEAYRIQRKILTNKSKLTIKLAKGGGAAVVLRRKLAE